MSKVGKKNKIRKKEKIIVGLMSSTILGVGVTMSNAKTEEKVEENEKAKKKKKPTKLIVKEWPTIDMKRDLTTIPITKITNILQNIEFYAIPNEPVKKVLQFLLSTELQNLSFDFNQMYITDLNKKEKTFYLVAKDDSKDYIGKIQLSYT
ncbi:hypothetical protein [Spiroplasma endosymbiont of Polydrusus pterygomalis]|uniref:hypothetical protein n=1 Tax=Spiroplasma endosymbiont of Polydrusus pterygomalis TaxID=3139327 RepID=UPI003CCA7B3D